MTLYLRTTLKLTKCSSPRRRKTPLVAPRGREMRSPYITSVDRVLVVIAVLLAVTVASLASGGAHAAAAGAAATADATQMKTVLISVEGMSCVACTASVKKTLASIVGVADVKVNLVERNARVRFDATRVSPERLVDAINQLGYRAGAPAEVK